MDLMTFFDINHTLVNIPIGGGYAMSWIEAVGTLFGLLCIWFASQEKTINYLFGLINVTLFAVIFYQIQLYGILLLQLFFFCANIYGWYAWTRPNAQGDTLVVRWMSRQKLLLTVGRLRGLQVASVLNNVVLYEQDVQAGVNQYVNADQRMMQGETLAARAALHALSSLSLD